MKLIKHSLLFLTLTSTTFFTLSSCNDDDTNLTENLNTENKLNFKIVEKKEANKENRNSEKSASIIYNETTTIEASINTNNNLISFDYDNDGTPDIFVEKIENSNMYLYKDINNNPLAKAIIENNGNNWNLKVIEVFEESNNLQMKGRMGGFRKCFQDVAGSVEGIALTTAAGFTGPWGPVGVLGGVAIGCAIWG